MFLNRISDNMHTAFHNDLFFQNYFTMKDNSDTSHDVPPNRLTTVICKIMVKLKFQLEWKRFFNLNAHTNNPYIDIDTLFQ